MQDEVDVTSALSSGTKALLALGNIAWLPPQESGSRLREAGGRALAMAAMPSPWRQAFGQPVGLTVVNGQVMTMAEAAAGGGKAQLPPDPPPPPGAPFVPGDRDGARAFFSGTEGAVYLLGGQRPDGGSTRQVWKYEMAEQTWTEVFLANTVGAVYPETVDALAYDDRARRAVVIDEPPTSTSNHPRPSPDTLRLLVLDTHVGQTQVVGSFHRTGRFDRISLAGQSDGSFVLVGQVAGTSAWLAYRFEIDASATGVNWTGLATGLGDLLDDPIRTTPGVYLPVFRDGQQQMVLLTSSSFDGFDVCNEL
jgi:hypothetical protein